MVRALNDILMITYNRPRYTQLALARLLETCDDQCRVWIWHNGDHKETLGVLDEFRTHPLIFKFHQAAKNEGQNTPLRWIFEQGEAPYVSKVDDDCLMPYGWAEKLRAAHVDIPELGAAGCWRFPDELFAPEVANRKIKLLGNQHRFMLNCWVEGSGFVLKRRCIEEQGNIPVGCSFPRYCVNLAARGWINGWYFPFLFQEHMDHPWSQHTMFKSDEDLERYAPVNVKRWNVKTLKEYEHRFRQEAAILQQASPDPRQYVGWRAGLRRLKGLGRPPQERAWGFPTPLDVRLKSFRDKYEPGLKLYHWSPWVNKRYVSEKPIVVIGGAERSGTTLLRASVDSHPDIAIGPESWLFVYRLNLEFLSEEYEISIEDLHALKARASCLSHFIDLFAERYCKQVGKRIWGEKSPQNVLRLPYIWKHFPNAKFVHIVRDGRDVACSLRNHPRHVRIGEHYYPTKISRPIEDCIDKWVKAVLAGIRHRGDPRYLEVKYEDLVADYAGVTRKIVEHVGLQWSDDVLRRQEIQVAKQGVEIVNPEVRGPLHKQAVARWRKDLSEAELAAIERKAGSLLRSLGYA